MTTTKKTKTVKELIIELTKFVEKHGDDVPVATQILLQTTSINLVPIRRPIDGVYFVNGMCVLHEKR